MDLAAGQDDSVPRVFLAGFNENHTLWPGPLCQKKPADGQYKFLESGSVRVVGDVVQVGWYGYYWAPDKKGFEAVLIAD